MRDMRTVAAIAVALLLASCSDDTTGEPGETAGGGSTDTIAGTTETSNGAVNDADRALHDAVDATLAAESFSITSEAGITIGPQSLSIQTEGAVDYAARIADAEIHFESGDESLELAVKADGDNVWVHAAGADVPPVPDGKTWAQGTTDFLTESNAFTPVDLAGVVLALRGSHGATEVGSEVIDGVETTRYSTTLTYAEARAAAGDEQDDFVSAFRLSGTAEQTNLVIDTWVDDDALIRRFDLELDGDDAPVSGGYTVELDNINGDVEAPPPPPADDVVTGPEAEDFLDQVQA